jgi:TolB protein
MYDEYQDDVRPPRSRLQRFLYALIAILIVAGLLGSSAVALWRLSDRAEGDQAVATLPAPTIRAAPAEEDLAVAQIAATEEVRELDRIAYITPDGHVATISPDGSQQRFLSDGAIRFRFPAWSPQGRNLAVIGGNASGVGVYILADEPGQSEPKELYFSRTQSPFYLYWAPDGRQVTFLANHTADALALHIAPIDTQSEDRLLATGSPFYWHWGAGGDQLLIHSGFSGAGARLEFIDITGSSDGREVARPGFFQAPGISASGRYLAYAVETDAGQSRLVVADTQTGAEQQERHAGLVAMGWSPTGEELALISAARDESLFYGPLRLLDAESGEVSMLSQETVLAFFWSPDGRYIAVISAAERANDINVSAPGVGDRHRPHLARSRGGDSALIAPQLAQQPQPFQLKLSLIEAATGQTNILSFFQPTSLFLSQFLPFFDQYALSHRLWSPSSDGLVIPMQSDGADMVVVVRIEDGEHREIAEGDMPFWSQQ